MGHIFLYRAWGVLRKGEPLPDNIKEFILHSLRLEPPLPAPIVADCLFIIGLVLGIALCVDDQLDVDRRLVEFVLCLSRMKLFFLSFCSHERSPQITRIYDKLTETFRNPTPTTQGIDRALEAMQLIASLSENEIAQGSYQLFHVVMQAPVSLTYSQEKK